MYWWHTKNLSRLSWPWVAGCCCVLFLLLFFSFSWRERNQMCVEYGVFLFIFFIHIYIWFFFLIMLFECSRIMFFFLNKIYCYSGWSELQKSETLIDIKCLKMQFLLLQKKETIWNYLKHLFNRFLSCCFWFSEQNEHRNSKTHSKSTAMLFLRVSVVFVAVIDAC